MKLRYSFSAIYLIKLEQYTGEKKNYIGEKLIKI